MRRTNESSARATARHSDDRMTGMRRMQRYALAASLALGAVLGAHAADNSASLTVPLECAKARLVYENNVLKTWCDLNKGLELLLVDPNAEVMIDVRAPSLDIVAWPQNPLTHLVFSGASAAQNPELNISAGFAQSEKLSSLRFTKVNFMDPIVELTVPTALAYLAFANNTEMTTLPKLLYQRKYNKILDVTGVNITSTGQQTMSAAEIAILKGNIGNSTSTIEFTDSCATPVTTSLRFQVCEQATAPPAASSSSSGMGSNLTAAFHPVGNAAPSSTEPVAPAAASQGGGSSSSPTLITIVVVAVVALFAVAIFVVQRRSTRGAKPAIAADVEDNSLYLIEKEDDSYSENVSFISSDGLLRGFRLDQNEVSLSRSIGAGRLWVGELAGNKVVVKRIEAEVSDPQATKALQSQARGFASLSHVNVVPLLGVTWVNGTDFAVVAEFMDKGNLKTFLGDTKNEFDFGAKLDLCLKIAQGLAYLHEAERNMYVRNFSSRKVLVNSSLECKLDLFDCYPDTEKFELVESYGTGEIAWHAPEIITRSAPQDPKKINIYAFGVVMCEILARAAPFQSLIDELGNTLSDVEIVKRLRRQEVLAPHENCETYLQAPRLLRDTIDLCLSLSPMDRPTAEDIVSVLQTVKVEVANAEA
ncbi:Tkl protein kinase, partial [Globisporangium splendens]